MLSVAWHGVSIPIFWVNLAKAGNSNTKDRMLIFSKAIRLLRISNIEALLGDREFIGEDWLHWLDYYGIIFVVRIKDNSLLHKNKKYRKATNSFRTLSRKCMRCLACNLWDLELTVVGYKDKDGNVQILATNGNPKSAVKLYAIRWQIESMFLCLKSNGFNLEETHMVCQEKVELLFGLLAILTCWNCKIGLWCMAGGLMSGAVTMGMKLFAGVSVLANPFLLVSILSMMASLQFMVFGLLGEVVTRIYYGSQQKQHYAIRELVNFDDQQGPVRLAA